MHDIRWQHTCSIPLEVLKAPKAFIRCDICVQEDCLYLSNDLLRAVIILQWAHTEVRQEAMPIQKQT